MAPGLQLTPVGTAGAGTVTIRNTGRRPCRLTGRPHVRAVGAPYSVAQRQQPLPATPATFPEIRPPDYTLLALAPRATAALGLTWSNWCPPRRHAATVRAVPPRALRVSLPSRGGNLNVNYDAVPDCTTPGQPSTIGVRPFTPTPLPAGPPWTTAKLIASIAPIAGGLTARRGHYARYGVRLRNASPRTVTFAHCPMLVEALAPAGVSEAHVLNCAGLGVLRPGASLTFEMRISVPPDAPLGRNGLFWELDPTGMQAPEAVSALNVTG